ncbi:MAG TPA: hypothetical protein VKT32_09735 [Chthonomonadaceae bacterium]|nr:hypothetical protein [Chthonomonadaceae bacterium]
MVAVDLLPETPAGQIAACAAAGIHLYRLQGCDLGWQGAGQFDYAPLEARLRALLAADPEAHFWSEVSVEAPAWWREAHPDECAVYCLPAPAETGLAPVSWASLRWRTEAGNALARLIGTFQQREAGARCVGWQVAAGAEGEWCYVDAERLPDIGPRMTEQFRIFAREKYRRNPELLRRSWDDPRARFETIACPDALARRRADRGVFRDPVRSRRILDYYECLSEAQNAAALHFCRTVRRATEGRAWVGLAYAHTFGESGLSEGSHCFPEPVLDSPDVDFFANAGPADGAPYLRALNGSLALRGKRLFTIPRGALSAQAAAELAQTYQVGVILPAETPADVLRAARAALERSDSVPRRRAHPVALIADPANLLSLAGADWISRTLLGDQMREMARLGSPYDAYLPGDLIRRDYPDHPVTIFLNPFYLSAAERRRVDARVKRSGQTAVWLWAPGILAEEGISPEAAYQLCGQRLRLEDMETSLRVRIVAADDPLLGGFRSGATFGVDRPAAPTVTIPDKASVRLGANSANKTVFAIRRLDQWTSVVYGAPLVPATLLRHLLDPVR